MSFFSALFADVLEGKLIGLNAFAMTVNKEGFDQIAIVFFYS